MRFRPLWLSSSLLLGLALCGAQLVAQEGSPVRMLTDVDLSPDGKTLYFSHQGDLWAVPTTGGQARQLTQGFGEDLFPRVSPDGQWIAFLRSQGRGDSRIHLVSVEGGRAWQLSHDSRGLAPEDWYPDGDALLVRGGTDRSPFDRSRLYRLPVEWKQGRLARRPLERLFDAGASNGRINKKNPRQIVFTRYGQSSWRLGYRGAAATQVWVAELGEGNKTSFTRISPEQPKVMNDPWFWPQWLGEHELVYVREEVGIRDLYRLDLATGKEKRITHRLEKAADLEAYDPGLYYPSLSDDGSTLVLREGFDLYRVDLATGEKRLITITCQDSSPDLLEERLLLTRASDVAFLPNGKEMVFTTGNDLFAMDRVLKDPVRIFATPGQIREVVFDNKGQQVFFVATAETSDDPDIFVARRSDPKKAWFLQEDFEVQRLTQTPGIERNLDLDPKGKRLGFVLDGSIFAMDLDGKNRVRILEAWDGPGYDWSPDGRYIVCSPNDANFNTDVFIVSTDGKQRSWNLSRHPRSDRNAVWSPDGKRIAWLGQRGTRETDIFYLNLDAQLDEETSRDRTMKKALAAVKPKGKAKPKSASTKKGTSSKPAGKAGTDKAVTPGPKGPTKATPQTTKKAAPVAKASKKKAEDKGFDLRDLEDRIHRIRIRDGFERGLMWGPKGKVLYFSATISGKRGVYQVTFPDKLTPVFKTAMVPSALHWLKSGEAGGLVAGVPAAMSASGKVSKFPFRARATIDWADRRAATFREAWRAMRDGFYDGALNHRDWKLVGERFEREARLCLWPDSFSRLCNEMLGQLNGSHLGFRGSSKSSKAGTAPKPGWKEQTWQLGVLFEPRAGGPGLLVSKVIHKSPAWRKRSRIEVGERLLSIDGEEVDATTDLTSLLDAPEARELDLRVRSQKGVERTVKLLPMSYMAVRSLLYDDWVRDTRKKVEEASKGRLGYLHIRGMNMQSFEKLEEDLFAAASGKEGLLIDVRFNGGGSTADHVLTVLTQPSHAYTVPRGGKTPGYPSGRRVYATWSKPIVVLCNQRSFSNAEILSHAIKTLGRGRVVGERTAGGVISTGGARLLDGSFVRLPFRGWYLKNDGEDMELNGCMPDIRLAVTPTDEDQGRDPQLDAAVQACMEDVDKWLQRERPNLRPRSQR